ncbi:ABC transporter ATP-binding protein [Actinomyces bowdenii]|uniref:ABC transporter ATP-binding protein n=1 Tax=Actinomyces bowdenii TaxID=131109 RepID=A0A3P1VBJ5_9ACTO|nr:ABC transporter ATP-binding protein [Actinomyces bowdenii]RRD31037.1 ABC transporter ATP-binding protein [Actinomyces bowdenii]
MPYREQQDKAADGPEGRPSGATGGAGAEPSGPSRPILTTSRLSKAFSVGGAQQHVLRNLDLEIAPGSFTVIMGPSGAGKSTLLYALSGLDRPTLGTVVLDGEELTGMGEDALARFRRSHCGFVFQQAHLLDGLSVLENLLAVGLLAGADRTAVVSRAAELLERVGLPEREWAKAPGMLSGGEAQRVAIARALMNRPAVVFADEPTGQLGSEQSSAVLDLLSEVHDDGQAIVMVTHDVRSAARAQRVLYLRDGRIADERPLAGTTQERTEGLTGFLTRMGW